MLAETRCEWRALTFAAKLPDTQQRGSPELQETHVLCFSQRSFPQSCHWLLWCGWRTFSLYFITTQSVSATFLWVFRALLGLPGWIFLSVDVWLYKQNLGLQQHLPLPHANICYPLHYPVGSGAKQQHQENTGFSQQQSLWTTSSPSLFRGILVVALILTFNTTTEPNKWGI